MRTLVLLTGTQQILLLVVALLLFGGNGSNAQTLPADTPAWELVKILIQETGSPSKSVDRQSFRDRLTGELAGTDPETFRGTWPMYADVKIDTLIPLSPRLRLVPALPKEKIPARTDTIERAAVYATTYHGGIHDNAYFFLEKDSIWRIMAWRQFPNDHERGRIVEAIDRLDTGSASYFEQRIALTRLLSNDNAQTSLFKHLSADADDIVGPLARTEAWRRYELGAIPFDSIDEYGGLDDDLSASDRLLHTLNIDALARLRTSGITSITNVSSDNGIVRLDIGSFEGEAMGYLYVPQGEATPTISPDRYYLLKPLAPHWYYFKGFVGGIDDAEEAPPNSDPALPGKPVGDTSGSANEANAESEKKAPLLRPKNGEDADDD